MPPLRILAPLIGAFLLFVGIVANSARRPTARSGRAGRRPTLGAAAVALFRTATAGYAVFLAIVLVFHVALAGERAVIADALANGALLVCVVVVPTFVGLSWVERRFVRRRGRPA